MTYGFDHKPDELEAACELVERELKKLFVTRWEIEYSEGAILSGIKGSATSTSLFAALKKLLTDHQATARPPLYPHPTEGAIAVDKTAADKATPEDEYVFWPN